MLFQKATIQRIRIESSLTGWESGTVSHWECSLYSSCHCASWTWVIFQGGIVEDYITRHWRETIVIPKNVILLGWVNNRYVSIHCLTEWISQWKSMQIWHFFNCRVERSIHTLCYNGDCEAVMDLIENGMDVNVGADAWNHYADSRWWQTHPSPLGFLFKEYRAGSIPPLCSKHSSEYSRRSWLPLSPFTVVWIHTTNVCRICWKRGKRCSALGGWSRCQLRERE